MLRQFAAGALISVLLLGAAPASAADTEVQLDTIANADEAWNEVLEHLADADSRYMRFATHDYPTLDIAVTDLDANGRLEVIFRTSRISKEIVAAARMQKKPAGFIKGMEHVSAVPIGVHAFIYEVTEDGTDLEPVAINVLGGDVTADAPDLMNLRSVHEISEEMEGARLYRIHTLVRKKAKERGAAAQPFRLLYQTVWLSESTLYSRLEAAEEGTYGIYEEGMPEAIPRLVRVGDTELTPSNFEGSSFHEAFDKKPAVCGSVCWMSGADFRKADFRANVRPLLAASWYGFSYGLR
nr:hypothetical protein [uncultured Selenomonas sp.]